MKKLRFQEVKFRNFLSYGNTWQTYRFNNGLNIIQGHIIESDKSNGSGKTSLTETIPFALFGKTIKKVKKADIVNWYNGKSCEVQLKFTIDDKPYEIRRGIKPNKLEVYVDGNQLPKPASAVDFQHQIEEIIGMSFNTFQNLIYFSPNNTISIINAGKPEKRKFLESLFDLSIYSKMLETVNGKLKANHEKLVKIELEKDSIERENDRLQSEIDNTSMPNVRKYRTKVKGLTFQIEELEKKEFQVHEDELRREEEFLQKCKDTLKEWEDKNRHSNRTFELNQRLYNELPDTDELNDKISEILKQMDDLESFVNFPVEEEEAIVVDQTQHKEFMKDEIRELVAKMQEIDKDIYLLRNKISDCINEIDDIKSDKRPSTGTCELCEQEIDGELLEQSRQRKLEKVEKKHKELVKKVTKLQKTKDKWNEEKESLYEKVKDASDGIKTLMADIEKAKQAKNERDRLQVRLDDLPDVKKLEAQKEEYSIIIKQAYDECLEQAGKIHMAEIDIDLAGTRVENLMEALAKKNMHENTIDNLKSELSQAVEYYEEMEKLAGKIEKEVKEKEKIIKENKTMIDEYSDIITKGNSMTDYLNYVKVSLKDENVKRFAISSLIPFLNQQTNMYLSESGFPYVATLDSWLDVNIRGLGVEEVSYGNLSGGETKCIDMAVQMACNDVASMMAKTSLNIMVLDEVLDSSVDTLGVQALLDIIRVRQSKNNDAVYVITHRNEIDEFTFDSVVRIMNEDKFSKIEVE